MNLCFVIVIFFLQCNFISHYFWLTISLGCPNHAFWHLIPEGTHNQRGLGHLTKMHLLTESPLWRCSFETFSHLFVKKNIISLQHYISFLHTFYDCITAIPPLMFDLYSLQLCRANIGFLEWYLTPFYHCLAYREFSPVINFLNQDFNI